MKKNDIEEKQLLTLLKKKGLDIPSEDFSEKLTGLIIQQYERGQSYGSVFERQFGKFIIFFLLCSAILLFYNLKLFSIKPLLTFSIMAFVFGFWTLIAFMKKFAKPSFR